MSNSKKAKTAIRPDADALSGPLLDMLLQDIEKVIARLDQSGEHVAAVHVQMAFDLLASKREQ